MKMLLRYFLCSSATEGDRRIRVEWTDGGRTLTSEGVRRTSEFGHFSLRWMYDEPPDDVSELALVCLMYGRDEDVDGAEFGGWETEREMTLACEREEVAA